MQVKILQSLTNADEEQTKDDMPEIEILHQRGMENEFMWTFVGGIVTTNSGHRYQVVEDKDG